MYVQSFEGSWTSHPFWRSKFLLSRPADLEKVRGSAVEAIIIDTEKGIDLPAAAGATSAAGLSGLRVRLADPGLRIDLGPIARRAAARTTRPEPYRPRPLPRPPAIVRPKPPTGPCSAVEEFGRAGKIVDRTSKAVVATFGEARLGKAIEGGRLAPLVDQIATSVERNSAALLGLARLKSQHDYTYMHSVAVCTMMIHLARNLGLAEDRVREAGIAGMLHDIGKMAVPTALLDKVEPLTDDELLLIRTHPERGGELLRISSELPEAALDVCLHHHERIDGKGYPHGLGGERISLYARMAAICDVYDAITSDRAYKRAWSPADSLARMQEWQGHFDAEILAVFSRCIGIYPIGGLVRLRSGRLAVVTGETPGDPLHPAVTAFRDADAGTDMPPEPIATIHDEIASLERPEDWALKGWKARRQRLLATGIGIG